VTGVRAVSGKAGALSCFFKSEIFLNQRKRAFQNGDGERRRNVQQELKKILHQAKVE